MNGDPSAEVWREAEAALVAGDDVALARLLSEHRALFNDRRPQTSWLGGLHPNYQGEARAIIAREHCFKDWDDFERFRQAVASGERPIAQFEAAVDAVCVGDLPTLEGLLRDVPELATIRSPRTHHSTLLHYVGANGVEGFRQRTPRNAVQIAEAIITAGADVDSEADMYGGGATTLGLIATSYHPRAAGVQNALIDVMLAHGARMNHPETTGRNVLLINGCLANGRPEAARYLAERGAPIDLEGAAGIGRLDLVREYFEPDGTLKPTATRDQMRDGFTWACEYGCTDVVRFLLDRGMSAGEVLSRPHHQTGLHWAAHGGHIETVRLLLDRGAPVTVRDKSFNGMPLGWALHGWSESRPADDRYYRVVAALVAAGTPVAPAWFDDETIAADPLMVAALTR